MIPQPSTASTEGGDSSAPKIPWSRHSAQRGRITGRQAATGVSGWCPPQALPRSPWAARCDWRSSPRQQGHRFIDNFPYGGRRALERPFLSWKPHGSWTQNGVSPSQLPPPEALPTTSYARARLLSGSLKPDSTPPWTRICPF